jgi:hypothetical protein
MDLNEVINNPPLCWLCYGLGNVRDKNGEWSNACPVCLGQRRVAIDDMPIIASRMREYYATLK